MVFWAEIKGILATALTVSGICAAILTGLDWATSERQKKSIKSAVETTWIWLNDQRKVSYIDKLFQSNSRRFIHFFIPFLTWFWMSYSVFFVAYVLSIDISHTSVPSLFGNFDLWYNRRINGHIFDEIVKILEMSIVFYFFIFFVEKIKKQVFFVVSILISSIAIFLVSIAILFYVLYRSPMNNWQSDYDMYKWFWDMIENNYITLSIMSYLSLLALQLLTSFILWIFWITTLTILTFLLRTVEFVALRLSAYEKGPILGISALLLVLGQIIRPLVDGL